MLEESVVVSRHFLDSLKIILYPSRIVGLMPYKYNQTEVQSKLIFSVGLAAYGVAFVLLLTFGVSAGVTADILGADTTRLNEALDKYVALMEIATLVLCLWTTCICFIIERFSMLQFAYYLTQVDQTLQLKHAKPNRKRALKLMACVAVPTAILLGYTHYIWMFVVRNKFYTLSFSAAYYISHMVLLMMIMLYWVLSDGVTRRVWALNNGLTVNHNKDTRLTSAHITDMIFVYENIFSSLTAFNNALSPIILMIMMNILVSLIASLYVIVKQALQGYDVKTRVMEMMWITFHFGRLILIVEPAYRLSEGLYRVRMLVSELLSLDVDEEMKIQMETLTTHVLLSTSGSFSPGGMFQVNRGVFISVIGTVATYVVLILNFHDKLE